MTDAISRRAAIAAVSYCGEITPREAREELMGLPALDVQPVVHARWVTQGIEVYCTNCMMPQDCGTNFCAHCGARMDGETE